MEGDTCEVKQISVSPLYPESEQVLVGAIVSLSNEEQVTITSFRLFSKQQWIDYLCRNCQMFNLPYLS